MPDDHDTDGTDESTIGFKINRRRVMKSIGAGTAAVSGIGISSNTAIGAENEEQDFVEITGTEKNTTRSIALRSSKYRNIRDYVMSEYSVRPAINNTDVYKKPYDEADRYVVEIPLPGISNSIHSAVVVMLEDESVVGASGGTAETDGNRVIKYTQFSIEPDGSVTSNTVSLATDQDRRKFNVESDSSGVTISSQCSSCAWVVRRICTYGCGLSAVAFCALIGAKFPVAGVGCGAFYVAYCFELDASGRCYARGSPTADCRLMGYC